MWHGFEPAGLVRSGAILDAKRLPAGPPPARPVTLAVPLRRSLFSVDGGAGFEQLAAGVGHVHIANLGGHTELGRDAPALNRMTCWRVCAGRGPEGSSTCKPPHHPAPCHPRRWHMQSPDWSHWRPPAAARSVTAAHSDGTELLPQAQSLCRTDRRPLPAALAAAGRRRPPGCCTTHPPAFSSIRLGSWC